MHFILILSYSIHTLQKMFKWFVGSDDSKKYKQLSNLGLFSENISIQYIKYEEYFRAFTNIRFSFTEHIKIFTKEHPTSLKIIKALIFIHAWLQSATMLDDSQSLLNLMSHFLKCCSQLIQRSKENQLNEYKRGKSRSVVMNLDLQRQSKELLFNKQIFLLEDIVRPYILYLQKVITVFIFYSSIKKNIFRLININQVWMVMNLFKCANAVISKIPIICKFIRKSYKPIAESLGQAFSLDFSFFYLKIQKYIYSQCNKIEQNFEILVEKLGEIEAYMQGVEGTESIVNLVQELNQLNIEIYALYGEPSFKGNRNIIRINPINLNDQKIQFILYLQKMKYNAELYEKTPKFYRSYQSKMTTQNDSQQVSNLQLAIFKDISNENYEKEEAIANKPKLCTFRRVEAEANDVQQRVACHLMVVKNKKDIQEG